MQLAARFAETFAATVEGASVRASLPTLRRSVASVRDVLSRTRVSPKRVPSVKTTAAPSRWPARRMATRSRPG